MIVSVLYIILAVIALSFLIFIHELGHYLMARRVGMRVETFSIGFGKPLYSWERDGVKWQIGWLFFGGYVKIAGQDPSQDVDPYEVSDGFFGKSPWDRIKVAIAGPFMNLVFALLLFVLLWSLGGREKNFSEYTSKVGWVDPQSELYEQGVRPGDEVVAYGGRTYQGAKDHITSAMTASNNKLLVTVNHVDYFTGEKETEELSVKVYPHPAAIDNGIETAGITRPANYLLYKKLPGGVENPLQEGSPMKESGLELGDRIVWVDGQVIFSLEQLNHVLNDDRALLTVEREGTSFLRRVPRVQTQELRLNSEYREELTDWQYEAQLANTKFRNLYTIPYNLNAENEIESIVKFIDRDNEEEAFPKVVYSSEEEPLQVGDQIVAVDNHPVRFPYELINYLQDKRSNIIVQRGTLYEDAVLWDAADEEFDKQLNWADLQEIEKSIGSADSVDQKGNLYLLNTVKPKKISDFELPPELAAIRATTLQEQRKKIEKISDPKKRAYALDLLENQENQLILGIPGVQDRKVQFNPAPTTLFSNITGEIGNTLRALVTGTLNPKWMSGPVGIIHMVQHQSMVSLKESLFWVGLISLNLGILNLLPIPVLDGGTIVFSLYEMITRKRIHPKTMEKLVIPFALLLIGFFIFLTYNDIERIISRFFS